MFFSGSDEPTTRFTQLCSELLLSYTYEYQATIKPLNTDSVAT